MAVRKPYPDPETGQMVGDYAENPQTGGPAGVPPNQLMGMNGGIQPTGDGIPPKGDGPGGLPTHASESAETPRERADVQLRSLGGGAGATPSRPASPSPMAGSVSQVPPPGSPQPFQPLPSQDLASLANPRRRGFLGGAGGLLGGGLGIGGTNPAAAPDISALIKQLIGGM
jgi:hypothetical protein